MTPLARWICGAGIAGAGAVGYGVHSHVPQPYTKTQQSPIVVVQDTYAWSWFGRITPPPCIQGYGR